MRCRSCCMFVLALLSGPVAVFSADEEVPETASIRPAIERAIPLLEQGAFGSSRQRKCFTCHNQALPVMVLSKAQKDGFSVDPENLEKQVQHTVAHLNRGLANYREGRGQGGQVITAGYALWSLLEAGLESSETTTAVSHYLLEYQKDTDHWSHRGSRPPSSGSDFTTTYVALHSLMGFGTAEQQSRIDARIRTISPWILKEIPQDTEDHVFRLRLLPYIDAEKPFIEKAISELVDLQRSDGGWAQTSDLQSDAYATASVLLALIQVSERTLQDPVISRGVDYLLKQQTKEGSWHVVSRAKPFQTYYESGFPYGADQFISITASSWATWVLLEVLRH